MAGERSQSIRGSDKNGAGFDSQDKPQASFYEVLFSAGAEVNVLFIVYVVRINARWLAKPTW